LPLSDEARKALDAVCPAAGVIFGSHDYRTPLRAATKAAGIEAHRADRATPYDFRHSRLTHLGQVSSNLSGIMFLAGHRQPSTTAKYMRPQKAAAEEVIQAAAVAGKPEFWLHSGYINPNAKQRHLPEIWAIKKPLFPGS
jgi:integrase